MPQTAVLELTNLRKTIKGKEIVKGVNLTLYPSKRSPIELVDQQKRYSPDYSFKLKGGDSLGKQGCHLPWLLSPAV